MTTSTLGPTSPRLTTLSIPHRFLFTHALILRPWQSTAPLPIGPNGPHGPPCRLNPRAKPSATTRRGGDPYFPAPRQAGTALVGEEGGASVDRTYGMGGIYGDDCIPAYMGYVARTSRQRQRRPNPGRENNSDNMPESVVLQTVNDLIQHLGDPYIGLPVILGLGVSYRALPSFILETVANPIATLATSYSSSFSSPPSSPTPTASTNTPAPSPPRSPAYGWLDKLARAIDMRPCINCIRNMVRLPSPQRLLPFLNPTNDDFAPRLIRYYCRQIPPPRPRPHLHLLPRRHPHHLRARHGLHKVRFLRRFR